MCEYRHDQDQFRRKLRRVGIDCGGDRINPDPLLTGVEMAETYGCARSTWSRWVANGTIKPPLKIAGLRRWRSTYAMERIAEAERESEQWTAVSTTRCRVSLPRQIRLVFDIR
jgi:predicted site-specific integrase-resolvase